MSTATSNCTVAATVAPSDPAPTHRAFRQKIDIVLILGRQWNVFVTSPDERQSDQPTWVPILLSVCEAELEDVSGDERDQHQT